MPEITIDSQASLATKCLYVDGTWNSDSFFADMLPFKDKSSHGITASGIDGNGMLHGSGANTSILLRTAPETTGVYESGKLSLAGDTYAIRLETLCTDRSGDVVNKGTYAYSYDGATWTDFALNHYVLLPSATRTARPSPCTPTTLPVVCSPPPTRKAA